MARTRKTPEPQIVPRPDIPTITTLAAAAAAPKTPTATTTTRPNKCPKPLYFWRETHVSTGYLSQWYDAVPFCDPRDPVRKTYRSAEHYMMHHKALLFGDVEMAELILRSGNPRRAKELGRAVRGFEEAAWEAERMGIVRRGTRCKFACPVGDEGGASDGGGEEEEKNKKKKKWRLGVRPDAVEVEASGFREVLLGTGNRELVEASPYDRIWGVGFREEDAERNRESWGANLLGKALMEVREEFRKEEDERARREGGETDSQI
ncbi:hypothetical protein TruAng_001624 [Truncatella angustata]|nr:hypothetical protein TruAng_001624 [Truncatella angustata]